jgi:hypothetical protein
LNDLILKVPSKAQMVAIRDQQDEVIVACAVDLGHTLQADVVIQCLIRRAFVALGPILDTPHQIIVSQPV